MCAIPLLAAMPNRFNILVVIFILLQASCYKSVQYLEPGKYYFNNDWHTKEINFYENGAFHKISTVNDVGGYSSTYGIYELVDSKLKLKESNYEFFNRFLEIDSSTNNCDSLIISFKDFVPISFEKDFKTIYFLEVKGINSKNDTVLINKYEDGTYPSEFNNIELAIPKPDLKFIDKLWVERFGGKLGYTLKREQFSNSCYIKYPVIYFGILNNVSEKPYPFYDIKYWKIKKKRDKLILVEYTDGEKMTKMKYTKMERCK